MTPSVREISVSKWLAWLFIGVVFVVGLGVAAFSFWTMDGGHDDIWLGVGTAALQLSAVVVVGALVTFVLERLEARREQTQKRLDRQREELRRRNEDRLEVLRRLRAAYGDAKRARRRLQAAGLTTKCPSPASLGDAETAGSYSAAIDGVNEAQLALEALRDELEPQVGADPSSRAIAAHLGTMEKYLSGVVDEHNLVYLPLTRDRPGSVSFADLPNLRTFTEKNVSVFKHCFAHPFHEAVELLKDDILGTEAGAPQPAAAPHQGPDGMCEPQPAATHQRAPDGACLLA
jgi:membrane protein implicated in regulation of membrane protease activity